MALSNRDRIGQMFELAAPAFDEFLTTVLGAEIPEDKDWTFLLAAKDARNGIAGRVYNRNDPQAQLRLLTENVPHQLRAGWFPFEGHLSPGQKGWASELRDVRNDWAHNGSFSDDDAYRALDTAERLLTAIGAAPVAAKVADVRLNLRRVTAAKDDKKVLKNAVVSAGSESLKPWREVLRPHDDVATGNFHAAEFAADLYKVASGDAEADKDYSDPVQFFARTYLTEGLKDLIGRATRRLAGDDNASPVINLQTNFGGGKTHSMLSLWHLAAGRPISDFGQEAQDLLDQVAYDAVPADVRRVAIVGNHLAPTGAVKPDGTQVNTIWGELAWQLGGAEGFAIVAEADRTGTNPGEALHTLISAYAPAVILIDEWVAYARQLYNRDDVAGGTFDTQFTFAQSLTEAVKGTSGVLLAISIPASDNADDKTSAASGGSAEEVGGAYGLEALKRLQNVVRRVADQWRPASSDEAYHIVKRRLFVEPDAQALASIGQTAKAFVELYRKHHDQFPGEAREAAYEDRIKATYPIHPELFDRLYQEWSTLERFQRTRGVLRLMNEVIHALWVGGDQAPLILPGSVPLNASKVNSELTQYLQDQWKAIIDADVDGDGSEPVRIDTEAPVYGVRSTTRRLARTVFFGAAPTIGSAHKGIETQRVFLGTAIPGDNVGNFHAAINRLADRATYFYSSGGKLWYDTQANITRRAKDQGDALHIEDVWAEVRKRLDGQQSARGAFARVLICPEDTADIADIAEATLVIVHPKTPHTKGKDSDARQFAQRATESRGTSNRQHRNMLVFLAGDSERLNEVEQSARQFLGWQSVLDAKAELDLTPNQEAQAVDQRTKHEKTLVDRLALAYQWTLVPSQPDPAQPFIIDVTKADGQAPSYAERVSRKLGNEGRLVTDLAPSAIRTTLEFKIPAVWAGGHIEVGALWRLFAQYPYMPRLRDRSVLDDALRRDQGFAWTADGIAIAEGYDEAAARYRGLVVPPETPVSITDASVVVVPTIALQQKSEDVEAVAAQADSDGRDSRQVVPTAGDPGTPAPPVPSGPAPKRRFFGSKKITADGYAGELAKINAEVLAHLANGSKLTITIDVEAESEEGFTEQQVRTVRENAATLRFDSAEFEE